MARGRQRVRQRQLSKAVSPGFAHLADVSRETGSEMRVRPFALLEAIQAATGEMYGAGQFAAMDRDPRNDTAFGPLDPLTPEAIDPLNAVGRTDPRVWQYQVGWNLPGNGNREVPWQVLRAAADSVGIMRRCIEVRKKHVRSLRWNFGICEDAIKDAHLANPRQGRLDVERELRERLMPEIKRLREFWRKPWKSNDADMGQWINAVMEDYLVLDAQAIFPRKTYGGDVHDFEILDATTIKPLLDNRGARPVPPFPAFQQILYGFPRGEWMASAEYDEQGNALVDNTYSDSELFYRRENFRSASPYGFSPTEMALYDARLYLQRQKWMLAEYDDGSTPLTWVETAMPEDGQRMTLTQQRQWEKAYNAKVQGQTRERHRIKVLPNGWKATQMTSVDERYKPEYDLHLIKLLASYYGVPIAELGFTEPTGLGNNSWHEGQAEVSGRLGLRPDTAVVTDVINALSRQFLKMPPELEGSFVDPAAANTAERETVIAGQRGRGSITLNEERAELGQSLLDFPEADMYWMATPTGPIFIQGSFQRAQDAAEASKMQAQAQVVGTAGKLEIEHKRIEDGQAARAEGRDFAREQFQAQQEAGIAKSAEIAAYRNWSRKHPEDEPRRPFIFKHVTPDDGFSELEGIGPWRVQYEGWEWQVWDEITKSAMSWLKWNALHPTHPRGPNGRWVKAHSGADLISALRDEGHRVHAGQVVDTPSSVQGMDIQVAASPKDLTLTQLVQGDHLTPAGRKAIEALGPTGHPRIAAIPDTEGKIREAHRMLGLPGGGQDSYVAFSDLRKLIGDQVTRVEVDDTLRRMAHMPGVRIVPQSYGRENMAVRVPAALKFGGQEQDLISIDEPSLARPSQFSAYDMADELDNRAAGRPGHPLMTLLSDAELQAEIDKRAANDPFVAREMAQRLKAQVNLTPEQRRALERNRPAHLPDEPDDPVFQAQVRQAKIDVARAHAGLLAEIEELHFIHQASPDLVQHRFDANVARDKQFGAGLLESRHVESLRAAVRSGDSDQLNDTLTHMERELGFERIGGDRWLAEDQMVPFDPKLHRPVGTHPVRGQYAFVLRPGYHGTINGERIVLEKAKVQAAEPSDVARFKELSKAATLTALGGGVGPKASRLSGRSDLLKAGEPDPAQPTTPPEQPPMPPDARWPGWLLDAAIAAAVTALLIKALPDLDFSDLLRRFEEWSKAYRPGDPMPDVRLWITQEQPELASRLETILRGPIQQAHVEGALVGQRGAEAVIEAALHGDDPREMHDGYDIDWGDWTPGHRSAAEALLERGGLERLLYQSNVMIRGIADTRLDQIGRILGEGLARGDTPEAIARVLRERMIDNRAWAHRIAVTETNRAMSYASVMSYRDAGMAYKGWMTAFDQTVCPICLNNEFEAPGVPRVVPIDELFPSGDPWPPAHPHCRCTTIPVIRFPRGASQITKGAAHSVMSWLEWNVKHPDHPRMHAGRFTVDPDTEPITPPKATAGRASVKLRAQDFVPHIDPGPDANGFDVIYDTDPPAHVKAKLQQVFSGVYGDFHIDPDYLTIRYSDHNEISIKGIITDADGGTRGSFERVLREAPDGKVWAHHEFLKLNDKEFRGQGFAQAFNARAEAFYREIGVAGIKLEANIDVGGYAWARAGFDWDGDEAPKSIVIRLQNQITMGIKSSKIPSERRAEQDALAQDMVRRMKGDPGAENYPTPFEVSQLGRWKGAGRDDMWVGKAALLGSNWDGVKYLD